MSEEYLASELQKFKDYLWGEFQELQHTLKNIEEQLEELKLIQDAINGFIKYWNPKNFRYLNQKEINRSNTFEEALKHFLKYKFDLK